MEYDERTGLSQSSDNSPSYPTTNIKEAMATNSPQVPVHSDTYGLPQPTDQQVTATLDPTRETQTNMPTHPDSIPTAIQQTASPYRTSIMSPISAQTTRSDHSSLYATTSVMLVTFFMAICIIFWLHKQKKRKQEILLRYNHEPKSQFDQSPTYVDRLRSALSGIKRGSSTSIDTISSMVKRCKSGSIAYSFNTWSTASANGARDVMDHCHVDRHFESLKRQISPILFKGMAFYDIISDKFKRRDDDNESIRSFVSESHYSETGSTTTYDSLERCPSQSAISTNSTHTVYSPYRQVRSPSPAVLTAEQLSLHRVKLRDVSSGRGKRECSSVTDATSCSVSRASTNSTRSEKQQGNVYGAQPNLQALKSVELFRRNVHRVDMDFQPRNDSQVRLREGQHVVLTRVFEDGWVSNHSKKQTTIIIFLTSKYRCSARLLAASKKDSRRELTFPRGQFVVK